ncbi:MAG: dTMP kinase [Thermoplasmata archaeon]
MKRPLRSKGVLIALEGIDGAGKSTLARAVGRRIRTKGYAVRIIREPHDPAIGKEALRVTGRDPLRAATLFTLDRLIARAGVRSLLEKRQVVLSDRSFFSTLAYQGSLLSRPVRDKLEQVQRQVTVVPDRVIWIDVPPNEALLRVRGRGRRKSPVEREAVLARVRSAYRRLSEQHRWLVIDGRRATPELAAEVVERLLPWLDQRLGPPDR